jgi:DNA repair exonuclease SbcCD ATPase subunit
MILKSFEAQNLFSLGKVKVDLANRGLCLITGYSEDEGGFNGSGKSSLANKGVLWTLWGETAGGVKADAVLNRHGKKKCFGEIVFTAVDGQDYTVRRERPAKLTLLDSTGQDISCAVSKDTQDVIDRLLGFNFQTFLQTSFFGQGRNLHYPSLPPKDQKAVLESILPMEEVDKWADYATEQITKIKPRTDELRTLTAKLLGKREGLQEHLQRCETQGQQFEERRLKEKARLEAMIKDRNVALGPRRSKLEELRKRTEHVDIERETVSLEEHRSRLNLAVASKDEATDKYKEAFGVYRQWEARQRDIVNSIKRLEGEAACPTCKRIYDNTEQVRIQLVELELAKDRGEKPLSDAKTATDWWSDELEKFKRLVLTESEHCSNLIRQIDERKSYDLNRLQYDAEADKFLGEAQRSLTACMEEVNPFVAQHEQLLLDLHAAEVSEREAYVQYSALMDELEHLTFWKDFYGKEIKLSLFEGACPFLDNAVAYHLGRLKNAQIHVEFSTIKRLASGDVKEEFNVNVWSETGGQGFDSLSGGEQQMTSFAIGLALADLASRTVNAKSGFMILDEPFTELDPRNGEAVVEYLTSEVEKGKNTILLISNDEPLKGLIQNRIHVVKRKGVTHVAE